LRGRDGFKRYYIVKLKEYGDRLNTAGKRGRISYASQFPDSWLQ
jgi:hypothetical protein